MTADVCAGPRELTPWASPDGRLILRSDAPRAQWLAARRSGIGSSDASAILGVNQWTSPYEVWAEKRGLIPPEPSNEAMELGHLLEPVIVGRWSERSGIPIRKAGLMANRERPWQLASVDRLAACGGIVEAKSLGWRVAAEWDDGQTPDHAEAQSQHQMAVTGRDHVHVVGLQDGRTWLERLVVRDQELIDDLTKIEAELWGWVLDGTEPPIDGSSATTEALNRRWGGGGDAVDLDDRVLDLVVEWNELGDQLDVLASYVEAPRARRDQVENEIRSVLGDHAAGNLPGLDKPVTWKRNGTFAPKRFRTEHPEVAAEYMRPKPVLDVDALKSDHPELYAAYRARVLRVPTTH